MMVLSKRTKFSLGLTGAVICLLLLTAGCGPLGEETATLALKLTPQDSTTYRVITQAGKSVKFEGSMPNELDLKARHSDSKVEMTFTRQIQDVNDKGNATSKITIKGLKCFSIVKDNTVLDFDSSREKDRDNPLGRLIGQSYTIEITPAGQVSKVIDVKQAQAAVKGSSSANKAALKLLSTDAIKRRHGTLTLPAADKNQLRTGDSWSSIKSFSFGFMGSKSYEKIYTVKEIKDENNRQIAIIEMNAIPSSEMAEQLHKEQAVSSFSKMFDNTETYTGELKLDLTAGKVEKYLEKLQTEWVVVDPSAGQEEDSEPAVLRMTATRLYSLEKID